MSCEHLQEELHDLENNHVPPEKNEINLVARRLSRSCTLKDSGLSHTAMLLYQGRLLDIPRRFNNDWAEWVDKAERTISQYSGSEQPSEGISE